MCNKCDPYTKCAVCDDGMSVEQLLDLLAETANQFGVAQSGSLGFQYTLGLWKYGLPDVVMSIEDMRICHLMLNEIFIHFKENGYTSGDDRKFMINRGRDEFNCYFLELDAEDFRNKSFLGDFYKNHPEFIGEGKHRVVHFLYPSKDNLLPFFPNYNQKQQPQETVSSIDEAALLEVSNYIKSRYH